MRYLIFIPLVLLTACGPSDEERAKVQRELPPGCELHDLGGYGQIDHLVVVTCDGRLTTSTSWRERHGKTHRDNASVVL